MRAAESGRPWGEILAVLSTGGLYLIFENVLHLKLPFLLLCVTVWSGYLIWRIRKDREVLGAWGLRLDNLPAAAPACVAFFVVAVAGMLVFRLSLGWRPMPPSAVWVFLLYPVWAFIQQFVIQALVAGNLERLGMARPAIVPVAAVLFGIAHLPDWPLVALCAGAGLVWTLLYLRWRNLPVLAVCHAWLGALTYYWILERDPWLELFPG